MYRLIKSIRTISFGQLYTKTPLIHKPLYSCIIILQYIVLS